MARRARRRKTGGRKSQQSKMKTCAGKWRHSGKREKYQTFMKGCLKK